MEWSWLKDWWRLKKLRRNNQLTNGGGRHPNHHAQHHHGGPDDPEYGDELGGGGGVDDELYDRRSDDDEELYDDDICFCDDCMNGDIDLCGEPSDGIDSDCSVSSNSGKQVLVGICAMAKKTQSKPMKEILTRLQEFEYIRMVVFTEEGILKDPVESWPICDCLISFHSKGFPLEKAIQYAQLRRPYVINNLHMQYDIQDRRRVYSILEAEGIEIPRYGVLDRDSPDPKQHELVESEDHVEVNGITFNKPFVEKPVSAEDHNIYIYYPTSAGGGSQRLFRKIGSRSSVYSPESRVRKTGSFIYEDFMPTDGTDVKVYTVGPDYAHAEARKSPALDGKVERDSEGKEIRYPVILSNAEKLISRKVCLAFKQTVCGFDLLRANGKSFVCDVNGFSFVKNSNKYYDDCAKILGNMILRELTPTLHIPWSVPFQLDDPPIVPTTFGKMMELRCVVAVIRHGDRTPKQKMKVEVRHPKFFEIFEKYDGYKYGHVKLKRPKQLQEILDIARFLLSEIQTNESEIEEKQGKLEQLKSVLEMYGHFSGINRKVQMKYQPKGRPRGSSSDDGNIPVPNAPKEPSLVLILKWGGELTPAGRIQAEELGRIFRCMYPGGQGRHEYAGTQGLGLLRLHSTFRHDLKIYASDEGRVQMTAAAFAKGLLALEGELTPILVQMVKSANTNGLLDNDCDSSKFQNMAKNRLHELMQIDREFTADDRVAINPSNSISINQAIDFVKNPVQCCTHVQKLIQTLIAIIDVKRDDPKTRDAILYHGETWDLMSRRWGKIEKDFSTKNSAFDISKIPDIYDCIKYDLQHNQHTLQYEQAEELYIYARYLADIVIPQEYGMTIPEKLTIGQGICTPLLKKIKADLQRNIEEVGNESVNRLNPRYSHGVSSPGRHVRTRLYFTSESHVHSLLTVLRFGGLLDVLTDEQWRRAMEYVSMVSELNYMSQIVIMLYEDPTKDPSSEERFHVELHFSPGVNCCVQKNLPPGPGFRPHSRNDSVTSKNTSGDEEVTPTRIDEEGDTFPDASSTTRPPTESSRPDSATDPAALVLPKMTNRTRHHSKMSKPIPIGMHHTVSGHEAMDLAKRLTDELASQQAHAGGSLGNHPHGRALTPDTEPRARSLEQREASCKQGDHYQSLQTMNSNLEYTCFPHKPPPFRPLLRLNYNFQTSATNELPLTAINFHRASTPNTPESVLHEPHDYLLNFNLLRVSPLATNERPLSCSCLPQLMSCHESPDEYRRVIPSILIDVASSVFPASTGSWLPTVMADTIKGSPKRLTKIYKIEKMRRNSWSAEYLMMTHNDLAERSLRVASAEAPVICLTQSHDRLFDELIYMRTSAWTPRLSPAPSESPMLGSNATNLGRDPPLFLPTNNQSVTPHSQSSQTINSPTQPNPITTTPTIITTTDHHHHHHSTLVSCSATTTGASAIITSQSPGGTSCNAATSSSSSSSVRRQRHSIAGQMSYFKMLGFGGFSKKMATSTNSLFSTAVISGSSSAPNLRDMIPNTASPSVLEGFGGVPPIRPLETLHNALSLRQLDTFLEQMTVAPMFKTPASSPPKYPSTPLATTPTQTQTPPNAVVTALVTDKLIGCSATGASSGLVGPLPSWSGQSSMTSSISGAMSSGGPSSPTISDSCGSTSLATSNDGGLLASVNEFSHLFPALDDDLHFTFDHHLALHSQSKNPSDVDRRQACGSTPDASSAAHDVSGGEESDVPDVDADADLSLDLLACSSYGTEGPEDEEDERTISTDTNNIFVVPAPPECLSPPPPTPKETFQKLLATTQHTIMMRSTSNDVHFPKQCSPLARSPKQPHRGIRKQISLYERVDSSDGEPKTPYSSIKIRARHGWIAGDTSAAHPNCVSVDNLHALQTTPIVEMRQPSTAYGTRTQSCSNLKAVAPAAVVVTATIDSAAQQPASPGALRVRTHFIEPPLRVAKSFHGNTSFASKYRASGSDATGSTAGASLGSGVSVESVFVQSDGGQTDADGIANDGKNM